MWQREPSTETADIRQQLEQAFDGNPWHGPSVREILAGVDARVAVARPVPASLVIFPSLGVW